MENAPGFNPAEALQQDREAKIDAKIAGIKGNAGESRTDEEIRAQAIAELDAEEAE